MPGFLSQSSIETNAIEAAKQKRLNTGLPLADLTESNPTTAGFFFPTEVLQRAANCYLSARRYKPDARGLQAAREAIANYYQLRTPSADIAPEHIFITASTSESYRLLFSLLAEPGDNFLAPNLSYPLFELFAADTRTELCHYTLQERKDWQIATNDILANYNQKTRGILVVSPHNPTGAVHSETNTEITDLKLPIICDEVFADFPCSKSATPPLSLLYPDQPVFLLNGISKMFALPDLKLGWIALNAEAHRRFGKRLEILNDCYLSSNQLSQDALPAIFSGGKQFAANFQQTIRQNIRTACDMIRKIPQLNVQEPEAGSFLFPQFESTKSEEQLILDLINHGFYSHPGYFYGDLKSKRFLISCVARTNELKANITQLASILPQLL